MSAPEDLYRRFVAAQDAQKALEQQSEKLISAIVGDSVVGRVAEVTTEVERLVEEVTIVAAEASCLMRAVSNASSEIAKHLDCDGRPPEDDISLAVGTYAGTERLHDTILGLEGALRDAGLI